MPAAAVTNQRIRDILRRRRHVGGMPVWVYADYVAFDPEPTGPGGRLGLVAVPVGGGRWQAGWVGLPTTITVDLVNGSGAWCTHRRAFKYRFWALRPEMLDHRHVGWVQLPRPVRRLLRAELRAYPGPTLKGAAGPPLADRHAGAVRGGTGRTVHP